MDRLPGSGAACSEDWQAVGVADRRTDEDG